METYDFIAKYRRLWHLAHADAWPGLQRHGLLSAAQLTHLLGDRDVAAPGTHRPVAVALNHPDQGSAVLREQGPQHVAKLTTALTDDMTVDKWLRLIDAMAFFFPSEKSIETLRRAYKGRPVIVLSVDTRSLVREHEHWIRLASSSTGSMLYRPATRGPDTFLSIRRFDHSKKTVREVGVVEGVPDLEDHLMTAERWEPDGSRQPLG
jgi:hypothetical protein